MVLASSLSDIGCKRTANEDRILVETDRLVFAVADGMGGQSCGAVAAELAIAALSACFQSPTSPQETQRDRMARAIQVANQRILAEAHENPDCAGMGCTVSALSISGNQATVGSVGDSRVYLFREKQLTALTRDDSILAKLLASGAVRPEDARSHPMRNVLTQCVGTQEIIEIQTSELTLSAGDRLIISSDGLHGVIQDDAISNILSLAQDPPLTVRRLVNRAITQGGPDNISCIVVDYF